MVKLTEEQKQKVLKDPILDTNRVIQRVHWLFSKIEQAEEFANQANYPSLLSDGELEEIKNPRSDSDLGKAVLAVRNSEIDLKGLIDFEEKKRGIREDASRLLKERILNTLSEWTVRGGVEGAISNGKESDIRLGIINDSDYREVKRAVAESVKQKANEWIIKKMLVATGKGEYAYKQEDVLLVHKSFVPRYDEYGQLIIEYGKVHWKSGFISQEWAEVEQALNQSQQQTQQQTSFPWKY